MAVTVIKSDLDFILAQIKIAEAHAAGQPLLGPNGVPAYNISYGLRTVDGSYNNLLHETWGASDQQFPHLLNPNYRPAEMMPDMDGPSGPMTSFPTSYMPSNDLNSVVVDSSVRTISNLIVDQTMSNPAAVEKYIESGNGIMVGAVLHHVNGDGSTGDPVQPDESLFIPNVSPDVGLSASFNSWFTLFGQFFDHGLDLVNKGKSGTVFIPLQPDDPLYDSTSQTNFMVLTRATVSAGPDNVMGTSDDIGPVNTTTAFVDQNQTYSSHSSHQVFLREYVMSGGRPVPTGHLIEGANGGMANWAELKAQAATMLGIDLKDSDVGAVPLLRTDQYGNFIPGANGFPQVITGVGADNKPNTADDVVVSYNPASGPAGLIDLNTVGAIRTSHAFLADIAHNAVPNGLADGDLEISLGNMNPGEYDDELLDAHFMAGDGRVNENIGLTAVHHVFHAEHNRMVEHQKSVILQTADLAFINEWLRVDVLAVPTTAAEIAALQWDGARLFQAAKFTTEMQYQHLVFEEFARKIQPSINPFLVPDGFDVTINPNIMAEFAHVVYRFGHSMLTETIDRFDPTFNTSTGPANQQTIDLITGFLNPDIYDGHGSLTDQQAAGAIIRGMTRQVGSEIDEFVTGALRNNLLGLPLDLATINLARGRDTGVPSLNAARREFYAATNNAAELAPYSSWVDFAGNLKNEASIINFIAAYGLHPTITGETTLEGKRDAALAIVLGGAGAPGDAVEFLNGTGAWANVNTGLENVDLWIGGLAEKISPFGGMLGSTFNFVFEQQMEALQSGDRFYYLQRLDGLHLFGEMENNSFAEMMMTHSNAVHLPSDVFSTPGLILEVTQSNQHNDINGDGDISESADPTGGSVLVPLVIRDNPATSGGDSNYLRYTGDQHVVLGGSAGADIIVSSEGDDTLYGDGGNDNMEGGFGNDIINGGAGDDIIRDRGGDDNIKAGEGNDVVHAGPGLDLVMGGAGKDFIVLGTDAGSEAFAGTGDDFILGNKNAERILGNEGNDWLETGTFDGAPGDNFDEIFARDEVVGHDVFLGDGGFDEFIAEGGDDIMVGSPGRGKLVGMSGFDWATYKDSTSGVNVDLYRLAFDEPPLPPTGANLESYEAVEGISGSAHNDLMLGSDADAVEIAAAGFSGSVLNAAGIARITGLQAVLGAGVTSFDAGDIILGGDGNDMITGRGGNDIIDGDKWLNVRISVRNSAGTEIESHNSMKTLMDKMFAGTFNPSQLHIVREILTANGAGDIDTAVYRGVRANYTVTYNPNGTITVTDNTGLDGSDTLRNIEMLQFTDMTIATNEIVGTAGNDTLNGTPNDDIIRGLGGNDTLIGGLGNDLLDGGADNDTASYASASAGVTVSLSNPAAQNTGAAGTDTLVSIENLTGGAFGDTLTAGAGANLLTGGGGNDVLIATVDDVRDTLNGGAGTDTADYSAYTTALTVNLGGAAPIVVGGSGSTAANSDVVAAIENFTGGSAADTITGSGGANVLTGGNGGDTINAGDGADTLNGDGGVDTLNGGGGADTILGGAGGDIMNGNGGGDLFIGGAGTDSINTGNADDDVRDTIRFNAVGDFGDSVTNFDADDGVAADDRVEFGAALRSLWDDGETNGTILFASGNGGGGAVGVTVGDANANAEGLFLSGANGEGVTTANLGNAGMVAAAFNLEFNITAANGEEAVLVINDTNGNSFAVWSWVQAGGGEVAAGELTLVGIFSANDAVAVGNFGFGPTGG